MEPYSHPKCYANKTNECDTKVSAEHFISDNILEGLEHNKTVKLTGLPWMEKNSFNLLSRSSLVSNILCTKHNSDLSIYDTEAGNLYRCFLDFDEDFNNPAPIEEIKTFNGDYIEKWMLKTLCGFIASKQIGKDGEKHLVKMNDLYVDILFKNKPWPEYWGLYFKLPDNGIIQKYNAIAFQPMTHNDDVKACEYWISNFKFNFLLGKPDNQDLWGIYRINKLVFSNGKIKKTIILEWGNPIYNQIVELNRVGTTKEQPKEWPDNLKK
jgi:hypothetical protein